MRSSPARDPLPATLLALTFVTGLVDAVSYLALDHVFTANMTGNVVLLGFAVAGAPGLSVGRSLTSLIAFLVGAVLGGRLGVVISITRRRWLLIAAAAETGLLVAAALVAIGFEVGSATSPGRLYGMIALTALAMGLRNATVRQLAVPDMTTTVLTSTLTAVASDSSLAGGSNPRVGRRVASIVVMFAGAAIGVWLLRLGPAVPLLLSGACVATATVVYTIVSPWTPSAGAVPKTAPAIGEEG